MWKPCKHPIFESHHALLSFASYYSLIFLIKNMKTMNLTTEHDTKNELYKYCKFCISAAK